MNPPDSSPSPDNRRPSADHGNDVDQPTPGGERPWLKLAGMGMELAGSTVGMAAVGYLLDRFRQSADGYGVAAGALIGFAFGMFRLVQQAMRAVREQSK